MKNKINRRFSDGEAFVAEQGRDRDLGEVFTPHYIVDHMIILSRLNEAEFDATVFEPAVGTGNFIAEILIIKLRSVYEEIVKNCENIKNFEVKTLLALCSIKFNDIDPSNIERTKIRLSRIMEENYISFLTSKISYSNIFKIPNYYLKAIADILSTNAILGDFTSEKIENSLFVNYYYIKKNKILRVVYKLSQLFKRDLFSNSIVCEDVINYNNWVLEIDGINIELENNKLFMK